MEDVHCILGLTDADLADLGTGLARLMAAYDRIGIYSFNMNLFTGAVTDDHFRVHLVFSPRAFFSQKLGTPDKGALQHLYNESVCMAFPEEIALLLKNGF
jgi:galactose-1-phosphate uridylyltransferase